MDEIYKCDICGRVVNKSNYSIRIINGRNIGLCGKHYGQYSKYQKFLDNSPYSQSEPNEYEITDKGVWIYCYNKKGEFMGKFIIDIEDLDEVIKHKWRMWNNIFCTGNTNIVLIHQFLMKPKENQVVDHINGDRSDNRRCNLRITTQSNNCINKELQSNNKSGVAGVCWDKDRERWAPEIAIGRKKCHLGRYKKFEDAVYARYIAELTLFDEYRSFRNDDVILKIIDRCNNKENINSYVINKLHNKYFSEKIS